MNLAVIVVLLLVVCVLLIAVIGLKQSLADVRLRWRLDIEERKELDATMRKWLDEEREKVHDLRERLAPFKAHRVRAELFVQPKEQVR